MKVSKITVLGNVTILLTMLCAYQIYYYSKCLLSMGENYLTLRHLLTQVLCIVPGVMLGVRASWNIFKPEEQPAPHKFYKYSAIMYMVLAFIEFVCFMYSYFPTGFHQNSPATTSSFRLASHWWIYYWAVLVLTPSQVLSVIYHYSVKQAPSPITSEVVKAEESLINDDDNHSVIPVEALAPAYQERLN